MKYRYMTMWDEMERVHDIGRLKENFPDLHKILAKIVNAL